MARPSAFDGFPDALRCEYGPTMAVLDRWTDPDTPVLELDPGWDGSPCVSVRLENFSSPDGYPVEAKMREFCEREFPKGTFLRVRSKKLPRSPNQPMTFTRYLGTMESERGDVGEILQTELERLLSEGA